jgi:hypothetical protein
MPNVFIARPTKIYQTVILVCKYTIWQVAILYCVEVQQLNIISNPTYMAQMSKGKTAMVDPNQGILHGETDPFFYCPKL